MRYGVEADYAPQLGDVLGMLRIVGYAIVSQDGMIATSDGLMPPSLIFEADQVFYRTSLAQAQVVVHGRNSGKGVPDAGNQHRVIVTGAVDRLISVSSTPHIVRWNPARTSFGEVIRRLGISVGTIAVVGGTDVFELFLHIGYDAFYLSRAELVFLPGGRPLFRSIPASAPEDALQAHGLARRSERTLETHLILEEWFRSEI
jgi:dihydrofolate reductase